MGDTIPSDESPEKRTTNGEQKVASIAEQSPSTTSTTDSTEKLEKRTKSADGPKEKELSGKEKKELAKAQKAAKRAAEKQKQQGQPAVDLVAGNTKPIPKSSEKKDPVGPSPKTQHKRTSSTSAGGQSSIPHRQGPSHAAPAPAEPQKENKNVALFDHLYGNPRRTTIAGAGKDVNPSVLALGLQMRNYIICGSSARCVAMLLAFKRVGMIYESDIHITDPSTGHRIVHDSSQKFATTSSHHTSLVPNRLHCLLPTYFDIYGQCHSMAESSDLQR